jgi:flagellin-like protein
MRDIRKNRRALSPLISSIIMIGVTIACMMVALVYCQANINNYHQAMGECVCIERVIFTPTTMKAYLRNNGHGTVVLKFARINGMAYNFNEGKVTLYETQGQWVTIQGYTVSASGSYLIVFVTANWKEFKVEVKYP